MFVKSHLTSILALGIILSITVTYPASGLTKGSFAQEHSSQLTALTGNTKVCGNHMCAPGEWDKLQANLTAAQMGHHVAGNATHAAKATPSASLYVCESVKSILSAARISDSVSAKVLADLGCG